MTMGIVEVAALAATGWVRTTRADDVYLETHEFGTRAGRRSSFFRSVDRQSMTMFFPST